MSAVYSHSFSADRPTWLFVIGEPSTGKSALVVECLRAMQPAVKGRIYSLSDFSPRALLSGAPAREGETNSLLLRLGSQVVFIIPDFTIFLQKKAADREELMGLLRQLWDGEVTRDVGNRSAQLVWRGKCTLVAACTPALEAQWHIYNELGNRFIQVRWNSPPGEELARAALEQLDCADRIWPPLRRLVSDFVKGAKMAPPINPDLRDEVARMAAHVADLRRTVERNYMGDIIRVSGAEGPARIAIGMAQIMRAHASLFGREAGDEEIVIARRLALDSVPSQRRRVLETLDSTISMNDLSTACGLPLATTRLIAEDLAAIGAVRIEDDGGVRWVSRITGAADLVPATSVVPGSTSATCSGDTPPAGSPLRI